MPPKGWRFPATEARDAELAKMYLDGVPLKQMADHFSLNLATVKKIVKRRELPRRRRVGRDREKARAVSRNWARRNSVYMQAQNKVWHKTLRGRYSLLRTVAKSRGRIVELTFEEYAEIVARGCVYCGADCIATDFGYGIDRVDTAKGYTAKNSVGCCRLCNQMKMDMLVDDFYAHIVRILDYRDDAVQLDIFSRPIKRRHSAA